MLILVFRISLPCNGLVDANIDLIINININMSASNVTSLTLKRNKTCLKGYSQIVGHEDDNILAESSVFVSTKSPFYILVGFAIFFTFSLFCLIFYCVMSHKGRPIERQGLLSYFHFHFNFQFQFVLNFSCFLSHIILQQFWWLKYASHSFQTKSNFS